MPDVMKRARGGAVEYFVVDYGIGLFGGDAADQKMEVCAEVDREVADARGALLL